MVKDKLVIRGARHHNLKNINIDLPKNKMVVISGLSGSGKSTLAFDTIYAEGQRRYVESLSAYARQFLDIMDKPEVDSIEGLSPAISIQQKSTSKNPRSTVGTTTEIYDYLRLLYARVGTPYCHKCGRQISSQSVETICDSVIREFGGKDILVLSPVIKRKKGTHTGAISKVNSEGYSRVRVDGTIFNLDDEIPPLDRQQWHNIEIVVDRLAADKSGRSRLFEAIQTAVDASGGEAMVAADKREQIYSQSNACPYCGVNIGEMEPRTFSFNSPFGMCQTCSGLGGGRAYDPLLIIPDPSKSISDGAVLPWGGNLVPPVRDRLEFLGQRYGFDLKTPVREMTDDQFSGLMYGPDGSRDLSPISLFVGDCVYGGVTRMIQEMEYHMDKEGASALQNRFVREIPCYDCDGRKLRPESLSVKIAGKGIMDVCAMSIEDCHVFFSNLKLNDTEAYIAKDILKEIRTRLEFLISVGLTYLALDRKSSTLSGGEAQRIRLATQIGSSLTGVLYVLDEPTIGLHQRDNDRLVRTLKKLRDLGNTVMVVEHDEEVIRSSDWLVDLGPAAGVHGGEVVFEGTVKKMLNGAESVTGEYLRGDRRIILQDKVRNRSGSLKVVGASENNLKGIDVEFPLGLLVCVTGVSGSGKSTLVNGILLAELQHRLSRPETWAGAHKDILGVEDVDKVIAIDQSPIGRTPRSNPATYIGVFSPIREVFARTEISKSRGYSPGQFSFNVQKGRCFECEGSGVRRIEMQFLSDIYVRCDKCKGKRFDSQTLQVRYRGKSIYDILEMTVEEAFKFFENHRAIRAKLKTIRDVGLGYIKLGQPSTTLSGGEAQRIKLAAELSRRDTGRTFYVLDEPTTGLHFADVHKLLEVLNKLVNQGNTVVVIEHNMDVIANADWVIDLGPEGGDAGGQVVAAGTPAEMVRTNTHTGRYLKKMLKIV